MKNYFPEWTINIFSYPNHVCGPSCIR